MEIWHTLVSHIDKVQVQDTIRAINDELYAKPIKCLRFLIASGSGEIGAGINLYTYLRALPIEVETIAFGEVDVAAALVFLGGKTRHLVKGCQIFFHEGRYTLQDSTARIHGHEDAISVFKRQHSEMIYIIAQETGNDTEAVRDMLARSKIMQADEAKEFGLAHKTIKTLPLHQQDESPGFKPK